MWILYIMGSLARAQRSTVPFRTGGVVVGGTTAQRQQQAFESDAGLHFTQPEDLTAQPPDWGANGPGSRRMSDSFDALSSAFPRGLALPGLQSNGGLSGSLPNSAAPLSAAPPPEPVSIISPAAMPSASSVTPLVHDGGGGRELEAAVSSSSPKDVRLRPCVCSVAPSNLSL